MKTVKVAVTGSAGQIGYAIVFRIASGQMFGPNTQVELSLLELPQALPALNGVKMELDDCAFPLLKSVTCTSDAAVAFKDCDWTLLIGSVPRKAGMERSDLLKINGGIFIDQGKAIAANAKPTCKIFVVGNPCNTNSWIAMKAAAGKIPEKNFFAMTMLDQNRALTQLAQKANVPVTAIKKLAIWGNHSTTMYPNYFQATINGKPVTDVVKDQAWLNGDFMTVVQNRGSEIIKARGASSAASAANACVDSVRNLVTATPAGEYFSVAVPSDGSYDIPKGLMFSFPVVSDGENWKIVQGLKLSDAEKEKIKKTTDELLSEKAAVEGLL